MMEKVNGCIFFIKDIIFLLKRKYDHIWNKVTNSIKNALDYEPT